MLSRDVFKNEFAGLCEVFDREPTLALATAYYSALEDLSDAQLRAAVAQVIRGRKYSKLPLPNEIREAVLGNIEDAAIVALGKAEDAAGRYGVYPSVQFDDPVIHMVIKAMGGWPKFCNPSAFGDEQDWHWHQKEFRRLYEAYAKMPRAECPLVLSGVHDTQNAAGVYADAVQKPMLVGDKAKILEWTGVARKALDDRSDISKVKQITCSTVKAM